MPLLDHLGQLLTKMLGYGSHIVLFGCHQSLDHVIQGFEFGGRRPKGVTVDICQQSNDGLDILCQLSGRGFLLLL